MAVWTAEEIRRRASAAEALRAEIEPYIDRALAFCMPWRRKKGGKVVYEGLFDTTAAIGVMRFSGRIQRDVTPPFSRWMKLAAGPLVMEDKKDTINRKLELATMIVLAVIDASNFSTASQEAYADLAIGTAALLGLKGDLQVPIKWKAIAAWLLAIEEGPNGRIENVFWPNHVRACDLPREWPKATWPKSIQELIDKRDTKRISILQATYYDPDTNRFRLAVLCKGDEGEEIVFTEEHRTNPWIIWRWWTTSDSPWGRGPMMLALPGVMTVNKAVEMILSAASYQLAPPLMVLHDGVVNPDRLRMSPRAVIPVQRTGGPMGRSIEPLDVGSRVDLTQLVLEDERNNIAKILLNEQLPPPTGAVRSASEIVERAKQLQFDSSAAFGRMNHEFVPAVISRVIDILDQFKVIGIDWNELQIDQLVLKVNVISPLARAQALDDVQTVIQWLETLKAIGGDELVAHSANIEEVGPGLGEDMGVKFKYIRSPADRQKMEEAVGAGAGNAAGTRDQPPMGDGAQPQPFETPPAAGIPIPA